MGPRRYKGEVTPMAKKVTRRPSAPPAHWSDRLAREFAHVIEGAVDEDESGSFWFYLKPGWITSLETHTVVEYTEEEARRSLENLDPCEC